MQGKIITTFLVASFIGILFMVQSANFVSGFTLNDPEYIRLPEQDPFPEMIVNGCLSAIPNIQSTIPNSQGNYYMIGDQFIFDSKGLRELGLPPLLLNQAADMCLEAAQGMMNPGWVMSEYITNPLDPNDIVITIQYVGEDQ